MDKDKVPEFLALAKKRFKRIKDFEAESREKMLDDLKFYYGAHWSDDDLRNRESNKRPSLTIPRINQFIHQITNDLRQNKPAVMVSPEGARNKELEDIRIRQSENRAGVIRAINARSQSVNAFQHAYDHAVIMGRGFVRVATEYLSSMTDEQDIVIEKVQNPFCVYMDERRERLDYSDCQYGFYMDKMDKEEFKEMYPDASESSWESNSGEWIGSDQIYVLEYFYFEKEKDLLYRIEDKDLTGKTQVYYVYDSKIDKDQLKGKNVTNKREVYRKQLKWAKITQFDVLEEADIPGIDRIPIVPFIGKEEVVDGKLHIEGLIRNLKDPQKMYNYWASCETEWLSNYSKAQWTGDHRAIAGFENLWKNDNIDSIKFLPFNGVVDGEAVAPPQKQAPPPIPTGFIQGKLGCVDDMKSIAGIYDSSLGAQGNETSGRAILARQRESDTSNYHYVDNARIAITSVGQIENDWLPIYYDSNRVIEILGEEDDKSTIELYSTDEEGNMVDFGDGKFNVSITMGPAYSTRRQEAAEAMMEFMKVYPEARQVIGDLFSKAMDWPLSQQISKRLEFLLPPGVKEGEENEVTPEMIQMQQIMQQREQELQVLVDRLKELETQSKNEEGKLMIEAQKVKLEEVKVQIEQYRAETERLRASYEAEKIDIEKGKMILEAQDESAESDAQIRAEAEIIKTQMQIKANQDLKAMEMEKSKDEEREANFQKDLGKIINLLESLKKEESEPEKKTEKKTITVRKSDNGEIIVNSETSDG